jgi:hypothetical protein
MFAVRNATVMSADEFGIGTKLARAAESGRAGTGSTALR